MFHRIKTVTALPNYRLRIQFSQGVTKDYDINPLFNKWEAFRELKTDKELFKNVRVDVGGYGVIWNDHLDLSCDELYTNGKTVKTPLDD